MNGRTFRIFVIAVSVVFATWATAGCEQRPDRSATARTTAGAGDTNAHVADAGESSATEDDSERLVRLEEPATDPTDPRVVVLLHGYGSNERDLVGLARQLGLGGPIVSLRGPLSAGRGWAWFPINFESEPRYAPDAADDVLKRLARELERIDEAHPGKETVVIGFSQGAMMTMLLAVEHPGVLDHAIALSGALPRRPRPPADFDPAEAPLIYAIHGKADRVVSLERGRQAQMWLEEVGAEPTYNEYDGMGHTVGPAVVEDLRNYLSLPTE